MKAYHKSHIARSIPNEYIEHCDENASTKGAVWLLDSPIDTRGDDDILIQHCDTTSKNYRLDFEYHENASYILPLSH